MILLKIFAGRPRDLEDVRTILLKNPDLDLPYIRDWPAQFDVAAEQTHFLKNFEKILRS